MLRVGYNTAHLCRGEEHIFRFLGGEEIVYSLLVYEVEFLVCAGYDIGITIAEPTIPR